MKNKIKMSVFDEALREASRDFAKEMGYRIENNYTPANDLQRNRSVLSKVIEFINSIKINQIRKAKQVKVKC